MIAGNVLQLAKAEPTQNSPRPTQSRYQHLIRRHKRREQTYSTQQVNCNMTTRNHANSGWDLATLGDNLLATNSKKGYLKM